LDELTELREVRGHQREVVAIVEVEIRRIRSAPVRLSSSNPSA
jgi:hypothetical protein